MFLWTCLHVSILTIKLGHYKYSTQLLIRIVNLFLWVLIQSYNLIYNFICKWHKIFTSLCTDFKIWVFIDWCVHTCILLLLQLVAYFENQFLYIQVKISADTSTGTMILGSEFEFKAGSGHCSHSLGLLYLISLYQKIGLKGLY